MADKSSYYYFTSLKMKNDKVEVTKVNKRTFDASVIFVPAFKVNELLEANRQ